ncbi:hypothetical protein Tco_1153946 [Tanacetum coccineum]
MQMPKAKNGSLIRKKLMAFGIDTIYQEVLADYNLKNKTDEVKKGMSVVLTTTHKWFIISPSITGIKLLVHKQRLEPILPSSFRTDTSEKSLPNSQHENESLPDASLRMKKFSETSLVIICPRQYYQKLLSVLNEINPRSSKCRSCGSSNSDTNKIMARMDANAMTIKMDAQYKELQSRAKKQHPILTMMTCLCPVKKRLNSCKLSKQINLGVGTKRMIFNIDSAMKHSYLNNDTCFSIDVIDEILEEDFEALLDEGSKILHSIEGTLLEEEIFSGFNEFMAMIADENFESKSDTEEPPFDKITINADYKIKTSLEEPPTDLKLKPLPDNLEYVFLEEPSFLPVIISSQLSTQNKGKLISVLKKHKEAFAWKTTDIPGVRIKNMVSI